MASAETWRRRGRPLALPSVAAMLVGCDTLGMGGPTALQVDVRLTATSPGIRVERSGQSLPYQPNMLLRGGDRVRTGPATYAAIDFANDNTVYMNHDTWVMVGSIRVFLGEIFTAIARIGAGSEVYERPLGGGRGHDVPAPGRPAGNDRDHHRGPGALHPFCTPTAGGGWHPFTITANQRISRTVRAYAGPIPVDARRAQAARGLKRPLVLPQTRVN